MISPNAQRYQILRRQEPAEQRTHCTPNIRGSAHWWWHFRAGFEVYPPGMDFASGLKMGFVIPWNGNRCRENHLNTMKKLVQPEISGCFLFSGKQKGIQPSCRKPNIENDEDYQPSNLGYLVSRQTHFTQCAKHRFAAEKSDVQTVMKLRAGIRQVTGSIASNARNTGRFTNQTWQFFAIAGRFSSHVRLQVTIQNHERFPEVYPILPWHLPLSSR